MTEQLPPDDFSFTPPPKNWKVRVRELIDRMKGSVGARLRRDGSHESSGEPSKLTLFAERIQNSPAWGRIKNTQWPRKVFRVLHARVWVPALAFAERSGLKDRIVNLVPQDLRASFPKTLEVGALVEWVSKAFQKQGSGFYGKLITLVLCCYFLADLAALLIEKYIPEPPVARVVRSSPSQRRKTTLGDFEIVFSRNLFNSQGLIPGEETPGQPQDMGGTPVRTTLPLNLIGTLVLRDELRSIATIEDKSASQVYPLRVDDEIPGKAKIVAIEPYRVVFVNTSSGRREFVELPQDLANPSRITVGRSASRGGGGVEQTSPTQFNVARTEVDKALADLNQVLTQARAVPNFENGVPSGYKLFQIVPGSIYDKLGLKNGDTLCGLNGQPINDPGKAFELLGELKTANHLELCVKRDGRTAQHSYDIR